jgi:tetratricopeptide (TPR) repeat protein
MDDDKLQSLAEKALQEGNPLLARQIYEDSIAKGANDESTLLNYAVILWRLFDFQTAEVVFQQLVSHRQTCEESLRRIAHCYFEIGRFAESAEVMRESVARTAHPQAEALNTLAWVLERNQCLEGARDLAESALKLESSYSQAVRLLAHIDRREGNLDRAADRLQQQLRTYPGSFDWGLQYELAAILDRQSKFQEAWDVLCLAKQQLVPQAKSYLAASFAIRSRQKHVTKRVTDVDLRRWINDKNDIYCDRRHCILTGFPRSGTTLLEQMLAAHPDVVDTDESGILATQFIAPMVWQAPDIHQILVELRGFDDEQLLAGREAYFCMTEQYLDLPIGNRLMVEKDPLLTADLPFPLRLFPQTKLLIALRDPRDVIISYFFTMVPLNWNSAPSISIEHTCQFYCDVLRHWLWWRERLPWPFLETRYEHTIADAKTEVERICHFLGLDWQPSMIDHQSRRERKAVRTPTYDDITKPLYHRALGRWHNYEPQLAHLLPGLNFVLKELGYDES